MNNYTDNVRCACGGNVYDGYMHGNQFVAGTVDLSLAFRGKEVLLNEVFPHGIPPRGKAATICSKCFRMIVTDKRRPS